MEDDTPAIRTTVTSSPYQAAQFINEIASDRHEEGLIVGIDTEWRECRQPDGHRCYKVAVLQLCVGRRCLVFQLYRANNKVPRELVDFLADPAVRFVGVGVDGDVKRLAENCNLKVASTVDLGGAAAATLGRPELKTAGLKSLALTVMGARMEKPKRITISNWAAETLTKQQVNYACIDAYASYEIGRRPLSGESIPPAQS